MPYTLSKQRRIITAAVKHVRALFKADRSGHDWYHIERVRVMAERIARQEKADRFLVDLMVIFHEIADGKIIGEGNEDEALATTGKWLQKHQLHAADIEHILYVIANQSYAVSGVGKFKLKTLEGRVVQDADRLEALGAIGIARCFIYGGKKGRILHDPALKPRRITSSSQYRNSETTLNHFYEKVLKLKGLMNTNAGKKIARGRHQFVQAYLKQFLAEWQGIG